MKVVEGHMVSLGYGKYFRSDSIVGLEPIEEGRGPGSRTHVFVKNLSRPIVASRTEHAILADLVDRPTEITKGKEQYQLLADVLDTIQGIEPMLRSIIRDQGNWDLDRVEEQIKDALSEPVAEKESPNQPLPF
jgi:hypothetical protein